jgi:4-amino-4-deoxy-L-arabinose transferase-like glycosyltransferase
VIARIVRAWPAWVLLVALTVRLWGIGWQLPAALYFDEMKYVERAGAAVHGQPPDDADFRNPTLFRHFLELEYGLAGLGNPGTDPREAAISQLALARITSAILGALACLLTGLATAILGARRPSDAWVGLSAGLILALAPLHVHLSHYAVNDASASFLLAATLYCGARTLVAPTGRDFFLAGVLAALAAATKYSFGVGVVMPLVASVGAGGSVGARFQPARRGVRAGLWAGLTLAGFVVGLVVGMPEVVVSPGFVLAGIAEQTRLGTIRWNGQSADPIWQLYAETLVRGLGWPAMAMAFAGMVALWRRDRLALTAVLSVPAAYLGIMLQQALFFARFALPLLPPLAVLAGLGVGALTEALGQRVGTRRAPALGAAMLAVVLLPAAWTTLQIDRLATTTDTRILAQRWLDEHAEGSRAVTEVYGQPITWTGGAGSRGYRLQRTAALVEATTIRRLACDGVRYFVVASLTSERETTRRALAPEDSGYDLLTRAGEIVAAFDPFWPGMTAPAHPDDTGIPFWHVEAYARPGPSVTIYELPEGAVPCGSGR